MRDGEPPSMVSHSRRRPERGEVAANVVYADEGTAEYAKLKPEGAR
jgi:hypothetical protein